MPANLPQQSVTITSSTGGFSVSCTNTIITLYASCNYTNGQVAYIWTGSTFASPVYNNSITVGAGTYTVAASSGTTLIGVQSVTVIQGPVAPNVFITESDSQVSCSSPSVQLQGSSSMPGALYQWNGPSPFDTPAPGSTATAFVAGVYTLVVANAADPACKTVSTTVIGDNQFYPVISLAPIYSVSCPNGTVALTPTVIPTSNVSFSWTVLQGAVPSGVTTGTLITGGSGLYKLDVTNNANGCTTWVIVNVWACAGIEDYANELANAQIFPNPVKDALYFQSDATLAGKVKLSISNVLGQLIYVDTDLDTNKRLDLAFLKTQVYYVTLQTTQSQKTFKLVKE